MKPSQVLTQVLKGIEKSPHLKYISPMTDPSETPEAEMRPKDELPKRKNHHRHLTLRGPRAMLSF